MEEENNEVKDNSLLKGEEVQQNENDEEQEEESVNFILFDNDKVIEWGKELDLSEKTINTIESMQLNGFDIFNEAQSINNLNNITQGNIHDKNAILREVNTIALDFFKIKVILPEHSDIVIELENDPNITVEEICSHLSFLIGKNDKKIYLRTLDDKELLYPNIKIIPRILLNPMKYKTLTLFTMKKEENNQFTTISYSSNKQVFESQNVNSNNNNSKQIQSNINYYKSNKTSDVTSMEINEDDRINHKNFGLSQSEQNEKLRELAKRHAYSFVSSDGIISKNPIKLEREKTGADTFKRKGSAVLNNKNDITAVNNNNINKEGYSTSFLFTRYRDQKGQNVVGSYSNPSYILRNKEDNSRKQFDSFDKEKYKDIGNFSN